MVIGEKFEENGKKIAIVDSFTPFIDDLFYEAIDFARTMGSKFDEYRLTVNGCELVININTKFSDLRKQYNMYFE
ncbi:hypothetical protein [Brevibacillus porteri]|uniref:hypothetical protein n=1 Tax=Brevibacillus porteri TaxID=2126350 RepID=UPI003642DD79